MFLHAKKAGWALSVVIAGAAPFAFASCTTGAVHQIPASAGAGGTTTTTTAAGKGGNGLGGAGGKGGDGKGGDGGKGAGGKGGDGKGGDGGKGTGGKGGAGKGGAGGNPNACTPVATTCVDDDGGTGGEVIPCSAVAYGCNPPTSGAYYPEWATYGDYGAPVPRGYLVHNLLHGAVVISYNPAKCAMFDADFPVFKTHVDGLMPPAGSNCALRRFVLTPDPLLDTCFAAAAWGHAVTSNCLEIDALDQFVASYYGMGPKNDCADGTAGVPSSGPDGGTPQSCDGG